MTGPDTAPIAEAGVVTQWVRLTPLDTMAVRDGRELALGSAATAVFPSPSTCAGALARMVRGGPRPGWVVDVRGPLLVGPGRRAQVYLPAPHDVLVQGGRLRRAPLPGGTYLDEVDAEAVGGWVPARWLQRYLSGAPLAATRADDASVAQLQPGPVSQQRIGIARQGRLVLAGMLYGAEHLRLPEDSDGSWSLVMSCRLYPGQWVKPGLAPLGGRGRHARVEAIAPLGWPDRPSDFPRGRVLVYLATPALLTRGTGWAPQDAEQIGFACAGPQPVATAVRGRVDSSFLRWAVPAGTVYYLKFPSERAAAEWAEIHHGKCLPDQMSPEAATAGFGLSFIGSWM